jgi:hypothetical protein
MDPIGWFIFNSHKLLGHYKAMALSGIPPRSKDGCLLCAYDRGEVSYQAVMVALYPSTQCPVPAVPYLAQPSAHDGPG